MQGGGMKMWRRAFNGAHLMTVFTPDRLTSFIVALFQKKFGTVVACMDGRSVFAVTSFLRRKYRILYPDMITEPGMDGFLSSIKVSEDTIQDIQRKMAISIQHHGSRVVIVAGHDDCAGNRVNKEKHCEHIRIAATRVADFDFGVSEQILVLGVWIAEATFFFWFKRWQIVDIVFEKTVPGSKS
jgi:hypothetical protein